VISSFIEIETGDGSNALDHRIQARLRVSPHFDGEGGTQPARNPSPPGIIDLYPAKASHEPRKRLIASTGRVSQVD
jgi:hypothetical protein